MKKTENKAVICVFKYDERFDIGAYSRLYSHLRRQKLDTITDEDARKQSAAAELAYLAAVVISERAGIIDGAAAERCLMYAYDEKGKPHTESAYIGISHTKGACAAFVSNAPAGIDIERIRRVDERIAERILSESEYARYKSTSDGSEYLIKAWSLKESYLKLTGEGIGGAMNKVERKNSRVVCDKSTGAAAFIRQRRIKTKLGAAVLSFASEQRTELICKCFSDAERIADLIK